MDLVNQTALPAQAVLTTGVPPDGSRVGMVVAKATFRLLPSGAELDTDDPHPLFEEDTPTEVGLHPSDLRPRPDPAFEVLLLGTAHAPRGQPTEAMTVALSVGTISRRLAVFGDRCWSTDGQMTRPEPFVHMPLTFGRAFGGRCDVWLDDQTVVEVRDPLNHLGLGFDGESAGRSLGSALGTPDGFPRVQYDRRLPNLELSDALIRSPDDVPEPACWAPAPADIGFAQIRLIREMRASGGSDVSEQPPTNVFLRSHPDWQMTIPDPGAQVVLDGCVPEGRLAFALPLLRVVADYVLGDRRGTCALLPQTLILLPDERRACLVYRAHFTAVVDDACERSFRLRLEDGWYDSAPPASGREAF